ncbi:VanZ family protein [Sporolactobacillus laevolacticus]|uniref:VanZ family protein n=1 Tax=Sporolactobacillus laevolacticus TaxID=33018 RepID=UPI0025B51172|nr:VanZ family protein [Sporolactobacillus laevolacticus]MDN3956568.1 VanZ family protein [Sporolactobacillus laevolacticus]
MLKNPKAFCFWLVLIFFIGFMIYRGSSMPYSEQNMQPFLKAHFQWTSETFPHVNFNYGGEQITSDQPYALFEFVFRKASHVTEYCLLTFMIINLFMTTVMPRLLCYFCGPALAMCYAMFDEWHQTFVPGRTGHLIDAFTFDLSGMILAMVIVFLLDLYYYLFYTGSHHAPRMRASQQG